MEKFLTKNVIISLLAGLFIMASAFWLQYSSNTANRPVADITPSTVAVNNSDTSTVDPSSSNPSIQVADLPNVNGQDTTTSSPTAVLTPDEQGALQFIRTPSGSTQSYDEMKDKHVLYPDGTAKYNNKDIAGKVATNRASLLSYGINLNKTLNGFPFYKTLSPAEIAFNVYSDKDPKGTGLTELDAIDLAYQSATKNLLIQNVPSDLLVLHTKLMNTFDRISQLIKNMEGVKTDKLLALNSARQYVEEEKYVLITLGQLNAFFKDKNIALSNQDKLKLSVAIYK